ncbi:hypothetical protein KVV02_000855 [Mortierella alpina]|uniref:PH domain-containing protein n=1 Tax=Mortierella alpina TaxID=64518 RepID=A0A9P8IEA0_MORAP|nr:hypothetical protein KVV02_000855 [Mortierella alpina]
MTAQNFSLPTVDSLLANTLQLHRQLDKSHSGTSRSSTQQQQRRQHQGSSGGPGTRTGARTVAGADGPTKADNAPTGLGLGSTLIAGDNSTSMPPHGQSSNSGSADATSRSYPASPSVNTVNAPGSPRPFAMVGSPLMSLPPEHSSCSSPPSTPTMSSFSSPQIPRLPSASTFVPGVGQLQPQPLQQPDVAPVPIDPAVPSSMPFKVSNANSDAIGSTSVPYTRPYAKSLSAGTHLQQPNPLHQPQHHVRRIKTSLGALASMDLTGQLVHPLLGREGKEDSSLIPINVRYVSKDLWIRIDLPRNIPVNKARDLILQKCQLTTAPSSAPSSVADATFMEDDLTLLAAGRTVEDRSKTIESKAVKPGRSKSEADGIEIAARIRDDAKYASTALERNKEKTKSNIGPITQKSLPSCDTQSSTSNKSVVQSSSKSHHGASSSEKGANRSHLVLEEGDQSRADVLAARLEMFADSIHGFGDEAAKINYAKAITFQNATSNHQNQGQEAESSHQQSGPNKTQQLKRLLSNSSSQNDESHGTSPPDRIHREGGTNRIGQLPAWSPWRDRHSSHPGKHFERNMPDHGDMLLSCPKDGDHIHQSEAMRKDCEEWKASFGLFWVAAGHWLDDSRLINSYTLQPQDLLELQLRSHYIQLPPPGCDLNYGDHYAEGTLFKLSKKSKSVSMLTNHSSKEALGVWKERWVVLQGHRLLIYHKRKDTTKKTIVLPVPLTVVSRTLPANSRHQFKFTTTNPVSMSSTMLALDISTDPTEPKICFRGTSEHDINHWTRIFHSLNGGNAPAGSLMLNRMGPISPILGGSDGSSSKTAEHGPSTLAGFSAERRRHNTTNAFLSNATTVPSINPILISNAQAAFSNLGMNNGGQSGTLNSHYRHQNLQSSSLGESKDLGLLQHHLLTTTSNREESRRRAITEPNRLRLVNPQQQRGHSKHVSKASAPELDIRTVDVSNVSESPFQLDSPPGRKRRPVLGTECLDNASQALLATSSARSSMAPFYSGYIWLYFPSSGDVSEAGKTGANPINLDWTERGSNRSKGLNKTASGRYVKCFAAINDQGQLHWVEVKKQNENEQELRAECRSMRSSYGIQLRPSRADQKDRRSRDHLSLGQEGNRRMTRPLSESSLSLIPNPSTGIQATMAHKLRLFFFCIKVPASALEDVFLNMNETRSLTPPSLTNTTGTHGNTVIPSGNSSRSNSSSSSTVATAGTSKPVSTASKVRHRLSSSLSTLATSALPPLPSMKSQSASGSKSGRTSGTWSSNTMANDKEQVAYPHALLQDRAMTAPASSGSTRDVSHKASSASLKSTLSAIQTTALQSPSHHLSPTSAAPLSPSSPCSPTSSTSSVSSTNVLSLAQNLQKAVMLSLESSASHTNESRGAMGGNSGSSSNSSSGHTSCNNTPPSSQTAKPPKLTLSEAMVAKQTSLPDSAATMEYSKMIHQQEKEQEEIQIRIQRAEERALAKERQHRQHQQLQQLQQQQQRLQAMPKGALPGSGDMIACPFLELIKDEDDPELSYVTLRGYTETEDGWRLLQMALDKFLDGPVVDHESALPPEDTLIPSYHSPPEVQLSEKAQQYLNAKASLIEEANFAASMAAVGNARSPTPDPVLSTSASSSSGLPQGTSQSPVSQIRATSVSLTRWMNLSGGGGSDRERSKKTSSTHRQSPSVFSLSLQGASLTSIAPEVPHRHSHHLDGSTAPEAASSSSATSSASSSPSPNGHSSSPSSGSGLGVGETNNSKRGVSPAGAHSMSVGAGTSLFRPRMRLNPQRSADELSKPSSNRTESRHGQGRRGREMAKAFYSTAAAMMNSGSTHNSSSGSGSGSDVSSHYQRHRSKSRSKHVRVPSFKNEASSEDTRVKNKSSGGSSSSHYGSMVPSSASPTPDYDELLGPRSMSLTAAVGGHGARTMAMSTSFSSIGDDALFRRHERHQQQQQQQQQPGDQVNRSSVYSEHSPSHDEASTLNIGNQAMGVGLGLDLGSTSPRQGVVRRPEVSRVHYEGGSYEGLSKGHNGLHPLDGTGLLRMDDAGSGGVGGVGGKAGGGGQNGKKHQTVLGASKAAVSGVFGKFRKSVG